MAGPVGGPTMESRNMILAIVLSIAIILAYYYFFELPRMRAQQAALEAQRAHQTEQQAQSAQTPAPGATAPVPGTGVVPTAAAPTRAQALAASPRVRINSARLTGSIALTGARIDDLVLDDYKLTTDPKKSEYRTAQPGRGQGCVLRGVWLARLGCFGESSRPRYGLASFINHPHR